MALLVVHAILLLAPEFPQLAYPWVEVYTVVKLSYTNFLNMQFPPKLLRLSKILSEVAEAFKQARSQVPMDSPLPVGVALAAQGGLVEPDERSE